MLTSGINCRVVAIPNGVTFEPERLAKGMATGAFQLEDARAEAEGWNGKLFAWKTPTYMTFGEAEWVPGIPPTTLDLREGIAVFTRDGLPPLLATISPLVVMTSALTHSIPRHFKELTGEVVSITSIELRLDRLLRNSGKLQLRGFEWLDGSGISASSATSDQNLPTPPQDFIDKFGEAVTAYRMIWQGLDVTLRRDFSLEIATVDASLEQIAESMTRLIPQLLEFRVL